MPRLKLTANCLYPTTQLPLVWPVWQKSCIEHTVNTSVELAARWNQVIIDDLLINDMYYLTQQQLIWY